ncbi:hypothetical protein METUNv1_03106 [Methyloversatilis universalis FAM5]|uniref:Uncharacterized protein n=2 Tax=Methyloversatilis universalis TaxID=378211 RepID=F5RFM3_METUF|nr:hypothetical protein METUNv1_03106 [Methyloversatilis universalis FAM5]
MSRHAGLPAHKAKSYRQRRESISSLALTSQGRSWLGVWAHRSHRDRGVQDMSISFSPAQLERFRREAKKLSRESSITHSEALDRIAIRRGFKNWSLLVKYSEALSAISRTEPPSASRNARQRYYLHGDVVEGEPRQCYCARCDALVDLSHFQPGNGHEDGKDGDRFLSSLARWNTLAPSKKGSRYRPADAENVLQHAAEAARAALEAARSPFHKWLERQRDRNDEVGDLACDVFGVSSRNGKNRTLCLVVPAQHND